MISTSDFYVLGGTLPRDARSYAVRKADDDLLDGLRKGQFCYVLTSRQMGKSSLMVRTVTRLRQENVTCLVIDLTAIGQNLSEDQWYDGLLNRVATDLDLEDQLDDFWKEHGRLGPLQRWMHALRSIVLGHVAGPIVVFVDEIDAVRSLPFSADEFFAAVRECYNRRTEDKEFQRLTFCLLGVATPADLIRDTRSTPFNIGKRIELTDFTEAEAAPLAEGLQESGKAENRETRELLARVLYWTHGHPYLTQRLCQAVVEAGAKSPSEVDQICEDLFLTPGAQETDDNLLFVRERLLRTDYDLTGLLQLYSLVRSGKRVSNSETDPHISLLRLSGVVRVEKGLLCVRNRIYAQVFDQKWIRTNLPGVELRRQRSAFRRGVLGTAVALGAILFLGIGGFMLTHYQRHLNKHVPLPDGTELIVNDVTYGTEAGYESGAFHWSTLFGQSPAKTSFPRPTLSLWLSRYNPKTGKTDALANFAEIIAVDEHGHQFVPSGMGSESVGSGLPFTHQQQITRIDFTNFPRRSKTIHLQLFGLPVGSSRLAVLTKEFDVPNPTTTLYPLWTPEPLPSTKQVGDFAVTLKSVNWSSSSTATINGVNLQGWRGINPDYECRESGQSARSVWQIESLEMLDATGNTSGSGGGAGGNLCIYEPAWRLRMRLARPADSAFTVAETWTLTGVTTPKDGNVVLLTGSGNVNGVTLKPMSLAAAPSVTYTDGIPPKLSGPLGKSWGKATVGSGSIGTNFTAGSNNVEVTGSYPQIAVHVSGMKTDQKLTVWATDEKGHRYNQGWEGTTSPVNSTDNTSDYFCVLPIPQNIKKVDLHFSVQNIQTVEFMVRPPLPATESKSR